MSLFYPYSSLDNQKALVKHNAQKEGEGPTINVNYHQLELSPPILLSALNVFHFSKDMLIVKKGDTFHPPLSSVMNILRLLGVIYMYMRNRAQAQNRQFGSLAPICVYSALNE